MVCYCNFISRFKFTLIFQKLKKANFCSSQCKAECESTTTQNKLCPWQVRNKPSTYWCPIAVGISLCALCMPGIQLHTPICPYACYQQPRPLSLPPCPSPDAYIFISLGLYLHCYCQRMLMGECQVNSVLIAQNYNYPLPRSYLTLRGSERAADR